MKSLATHLALLGAMSLMTAEEEKFLRQASKFSKSLEPKEPKNKYSLTEEQKAEMSAMTPKEKKKYLRELSNG